MEALRKVQAQLKAPKNQYNSFGGYSYRSAEDILEAVKPLLIENGLTMTISDRMEEVGGRVYVSATIQVSNGSEKAEVTASAREAESRKGMDASQITGAASSYARKYALNGMFLIDDTKDADTMDNRQADQWAAAIRGAKSVDELTAIYSRMGEKEKAQYKSALSARRKEIEG